MMNWPVIEFQTIGYHLPRPGLALSTPETILYETNNDIVPTSNTRIRNILYFNYFNVLIYYISTLEIVGHFNFIEHLYLLFIAISTYQL